MSAMNQSEYQECINGKNLQIVKLTDERDELRAIKQAMQLQINELCDSGSALERKLEHAEEKLLEWENREAGCCPENTPFEQVMAELRAKLERLTIDYKNVAETYRIEAEKVQWLRELLQQCRATMQELACYDDLFYRRQPVKLEAIDWVLTETDATVVLTELKSNHIIKK